MALSFGSVIFFPYLCIVNLKQYIMKLQVIEITQHELQQAMKHSVHKSKKTYTRKGKHKNKGWD